MLEEFHQVAADGLLPGETHRRSTNIRKQNKRLSRIPLNFISNRKIIFKDTIGPPHTPFTTNVAVSFLPGRCLRKQRTNGQTNGHHEQTFPKAVQWVKFNMNAHVIWSIGDWDCFEISKSKMKM